MLLAPLPAEPRRARRAPVPRREADAGAGVVRSPSVEHGIAACELVTEHGGLGHTSAVYATDENVIERFAQAIRTGRILVNAPTAVGALGGVYNSMTPTFSLGCGTWGGSNTTDNVNYRNLLNIKAVSRRQTPPQWFRVPSDTYFNPGALENLQDARLPLSRSSSPTGRARPAASRTRSASISSTDAVHVFSAIEPEPTEAQIRAGVEELAARRGRCDHRRRRWLRAGRRQGDAPVPREPGAQRPRAVAAVPRRAQADRALPAGRARAAPDRDPDHGRHRLGGLARGGDQLSASAR